ncbi:MAG: hypothetical protein QM645_13865 [Asticcacaulis sp.]
MRKSYGSHSRLLWGAAAALGLHALALAVVAVSTVRPLPVTSEPIEIELWQVPLTQPVTKAPEPSAPEASENVPLPAQAARMRPVPTMPVPVAPRNAKTVQTEDVLPIAAKPAPVVAPKAATDSAHAVTPKAYDAGGDKGRAALTQALLKREACLEQRRLGKPLDKDCALGDAPDDLVLPLQPRETRPAKLCIAEREKTWKAYREGRAAYPGIMEALKGNKDCRKDWD